MRPTVTSGPVVSCTTISPLPGRNRAVCFLLRSLSGHPGRTLSAIVLYGARKFLSTVARAAAIKRSQNSKSTKDFTNRPNPQKPGIPSASYRFSNVNSDTMTFTWMVNRPFNTTSAKPLDFDKEAHMEIVVTGRHTQIRQKFRDVVESKMNRVTAIAPDSQRAQVVLTHEGNPRQADTARRVEITVIAGSTVIRAEASSTDEYSALDMALDKLTLRLRRARDRRKDHRRGYIHPAPVDLGPVTPPQEKSQPAPVDENNTSPQAAVASDLGPGESVEVQVGDTPIVIRRKLHIANPMSIDEALYEMELIGHDFFLFVNKETNRPSVVYHRHGWSYGVFEIDTAENVNKQ